MGSDVEKTLEAEGYNVAAGSFGKPYKVGKSSEYEPVIADYLLPNYPEQEVVIIDLVPGEPISRPLGEKSTPLEELDWWAKCSNGFIDPRPRVMAMAQENSNRILRTGGAFIIFSDCQEKQDLVWARGKYRGINIDQKLEFNNWSLLSVLSDLQISDDHGEEIKPVENNWSIVALLADYLKGASFFCTLSRPGWGTRETLAFTLAKNKYRRALCCGNHLPTRKEQIWVGFFCFPEFLTRPAF